VAIEFDSAVTRQIEEIAEDIAQAIKRGETDVHRTAELLIEFAEEIKREAIEP
jgi:hypothetical protein